VITFPPAGRGGFEKKPYCLPHGLESAKGPHRGALQGLKVRKGSGKRTEILPTLVVRAGSKNKSASGNIRYHMRCGKSRRETGPGLGEARGSKKGLARETRFQINDPFAGAKHESAGGGAGAGPGEARGGLEKKATIDLSRRRERER